jgi:hypothetical protein
MLAAASELRRGDFALSRLSARAIRALLRPFWRAGWTNADLLQALRHVPARGGFRVADRCPASQLRHPAGWVRHRLRAWADPLTGTPMVAPSQWSKARELVRVAHGAGAAGRLRYGQSRLATTDLAVSAADREAAALTLARRRAGELSDARAAIRPMELVADAASRQAKFDAIQATLRRAKAAKATDSPAPPATGPKPELELSRRQPEPLDSLETWRRAVERARRENGHRPRRWRR